MENITEEDKIITTSITPKAEPNQTYFSMGSLETGSIEIDLVSFRQKNQEAKYLTVSISNPNESGGDEKLNSFAIDNEEAFLMLKKFFEQLTWNG